MNSLASNRFSPLLEHVAPQAPRDIRTLPGLSFKSLISPALYPVLFLSLMLGLFPLAMIFTDRDIQAQRRTMTHATGTVTDVQRKEMVQNPNAPAYVTTTVRYSFKTSKGQVLYGEQIVPPDSQFANLKSNSPVPIIYAPDDPTFNGIAGVLGKSEFPAALLLIFPLMVIMMFGMFFLAGASGQMKTIIAARKVFRQGTVTTGKVEFVRPLNPMFWAVPSPNMEVIFTFHDAEGNALHCRQQCNNQWLTHQLPTGTEVTVAYLPKNPRRSIFLEAFIH